LEKDRFLVVYERKRNENKSFLFMGFSLKTQTKIGIHENIDPSTEARIVKEK